MCLGRGVSSLVGDIAASSGTTGSSRAWSCRRRGPCGAAEKLRFGSWNVGTLTGKSIELVKILKKRRVDIACIQETRWAGNKAKDIDGWKLIYSGSSRCRNGVGILISEKLREHVVRVERVSDRVMVVKVIIGGAALNVISAYAPQVGLGAEEKRIFWEEVDGLVRGIPSSERLVIGGDFNGHIGRDREGYSQVHGGFGYGDRNDSGLALLDFSVAFDCTIVNSWFRKRDDHLITYSM